MPKAFFQTFQHVTGALISSNYLIFKVLSESNMVIEGLKEAQTEKKIGGYSLLKFEIHCNIKVFGEYLFTNYSIT